MREPQLTDKQLVDVLRIDPLGEIEDRTGIHHSHPVLGDLVAAASIPIFQAKSEIIRREMTARSDTHTEMTLAEFEAILAAEGFEQVLRLPVAVHDYSEPSDLLIWAHREGMLVHVCTYGAEGSPGGMNPTLLLNWRGDIDALPLCGSVSGRPEVNSIGVVISTGLRMYLAAIREHGEVVSPWVKAPFVYLLSYKEGCDRPGYGAYEPLNSERISMLPEWVRAFMGDASPRKAL